MTDDIRQWLANLGLEEHIEVFNENEVELALVPELTNEDLKDYRTEGKFENF